MMRFYLPYKGTLAGETNAETREIDNADADPSEGLRQLHVTRVLVDCVTPYQKLQIMDTLEYGRCLCLDGVIQSSERDEFVYHEALVHPALVSHSNPRHVLILGGGEGACLREVLRHNTVVHVTMVDIDPQVVNACRQYLAMWHLSSFNDPRVELVFNDARSYLESTDDVFDVIIEDVTDPLPGSQSFDLFTKQFYGLARRRLLRGGVIATQAQSLSRRALGAHVSTIRALSQVFQSAARYYARMPSLNDTFGFALGWKGRGHTVLTGDCVDKILYQRGCRGLRFYNGVTHISMFDGDTQSVSVGAF